MAARVPVSRGRRTLTALRAAAVLAVVVGLLAPGLGGHGSSVRGTDSPPSGYIVSSVTTLGGTGPSPSTPPLSPFQYLASRGVGSPPALGQNGSSYRERTDVLGNATWVPGDFVPTAFSQPYAIAAGGDNASVFVSGFASSSVARLSVVTGSTIESPTVAPDPTAVAVDPGHQTAYVLSLGEDLVTAISTVNGSTLATIPVGNQTGSFGYVQLMAFDPVSNQLFVADHRSTNVSVISTATNTLAATVPVAPTPTAVVYDPHNQEVYVADYSYNVTCRCSLVTAINASTDTVTAEIPVGYYPDALAVDPVHGAVYVANLGSYNVSVINDTTNLNVASIPVGALPDAIAYDPAVNKVFVVNGNYNHPVRGNVTVVAAGSDTILGWIPVGNVPENILVDPVTGMVVVANAASAGVTLFPDSLDTNGTAVLFLQLGSLYTAYEPFGMALADPAGDVAVASLGGFSFLGPGSVNFIRAGTNATAGPFPARERPGPMLYDSVNRDVYIEETNKFGPWASLFSSNITVLNGSTGAYVTTVPVPAGAGSLALDPATNQVFADSSFGSNLSIINASTNTYWKSINVTFGEGPMTFDPNSGDLYLLSSYELGITVVSAATDRIVANLTGFNVNLSVPISFYLPSNGSNVYVLNQGYGPIFVDPWTVWLNGSIAEINGTTFAVTKLVSLPALPTGWAYDAATNEFFVADSYDGTLLTVNFTTDNVTGTTALGATPDQVAFDAATNDVFVTEPNANQTAVVSLTEGLLENLSTPLGPSSVLVDPSGGLVFVLQSNSNATTVVNASTLLTFTVPTGEGASGFFFDAGTSTLWVCDSGSFTLSTIDAIGFAPAYPVSVLTTGLPSHAVWGLRLFGEQVLIPRSNWTFWIGNGTTPFLVQVPRHYVLSGVAPTGELTVAGSGRSLAFHFVRGHPGSVTFVPRHIGYSGTGWCVGLASLLLSCQVDYGPVTFAGLSPSNYPFVVYFPANWSVHAIINDKVGGSSGTVTVGAMPLYVRLAFTEQFVVTFDEVGLPPGTVWSVHLGPVTASTNASNLSFVVPGGRYYFHAHVAGFRGAATAWPVTVRGSSRTVTIRFSPVG